MNTECNFLLRCLVPVCLVLLLAGCTSMSKVIRELKADPATVEFKIMAPGWAVEFKRAWPTNLVTRVPGSTLQYGPDYLPPVPVTQPLLP